MTRHIEKADKQRFQARHTLAVRIGSQNKTGVSEQPVARHQTDFRITSVLVAATAQDY
jgi:hypothetical protein